MSKKTSQLIREVARLFAIYKLEDWSPVLSQLKIGSPVHREIAEVAEEIIASTAAKKVKIRGRKSKPIASSKAKEAKQEAPLFISAERSSLLTPLRDALLSRKILRNAASLREASDRIGLKRNLPAGREAAVELMIRYLDEVPVEQLPEKLKYLNSFAMPAKADLSSDYQRWFNVITRDKEGD